MALFYPAGPSCEMGAGIAADPHCIPLHHPRQGALHRDVWHDLPSLAAPPSLPMMRTRTGLAVILLRFGHKAEAGSTWRNAFAYRLSLLWRTMT
ncbi:hypothetical protein [Sphingobium sp. CR28]|uniref:hypothetical protein n=1 Tax=Sphingobium sp. CR28 TaxID=3400272 RepID=UPI003FEDA123